MRPSLLIAVGAMVLVAAKHAPSSPPILTSANFDPVLLLPPAPTDDSAAGRQELADLHHMDLVRTPSEVEHAKSDGETKSVTIFATAMGAGFDLDRLPATRTLFNTVRENEKAVVDEAKDHFRRNRPWVTDPTLHPCSRNDDPQSSYPSGHTSMAYSMAAILVRLAPAKAPAILSKAADYAHSRLVCEVHFPSDIAAGQAFGMIIAERLMEQPAFDVQFEAARAELAASNLR